MNFYSFIKRHPVVIYFFLAFMISWVGIFVAGGPKFIRGEAMNFSDALLMFLPMLAGPSLAGFICTGIVDGKTGLRDLFSRMGLWRVGVQWYSAILIFPILIVVVLLPLSALLSPNFAPYFFPLGILIGLIGGFFEEIGWTGYALPKMRLMHSALATSILLGLLHTAWHLPADFLSASVARGIYWLPHFAMFVVSMTAMRVLIVWVYTNTRSVLLAQLMHASSTGFLSILVPLSLSPKDDTVFYAVYSVVLWVAVAIVVANYGKHLVRQPISPQLA